MFTKTLTALLALSASALAFTTPTTFNVTSNPVFTPATNSIVPAGKPFEITWGVTESGTVSIILLRGPANNILPLYPIVEKIPNKGSYTWTPKTSLEPDTTHYGIQIIIDANGQYQYSGQFGISNAGFVSTSAAATTSTATTSATSTEETTTSVETVYYTTKSQVTSIVYITTSTAAPTTLATSSYVAPVYTSSSTGNYTATYSPPGSSSATLPPVPSQTGAASSVKVAGSLFLGVVGAAAMLL
jgi:hypothetical protein